MPLPLYYALSFVTSEGGISVVVQARALETRQRIIDTAVRLFAENGYLVTDLKDICRASDLSPGAFYYHFTSKEELQTAIIDSAWPQALALYEAFQGIPGAGLENVIVMTYATTALYRQRDDWWVALQFLHALGNLDPRGRRELGHRSEIYAGLVAAAIRRHEISDAFTAEEVGELLFINMTGATITSDAQGAGLSAALDRQTLLWRALLAAAVPADTLPRMQRILEETAKRYGDAISDVEKLHEEIRADIARARRDTGDAATFFARIGIATDSPAAQAQAV